MVYYERVGNLHVHTVASDGTGSVTQVAEAARSAGLDYLIITDHNVWQPDLAGWYGGTLALVGQEIHNPGRALANHLLVLGADRDLSAESADLRHLISMVRQAGGLAYIAHPIEKSGTRANEPEINWIDREVQGLHGIELWNYMSEFKSNIETMASALLYAFLPDLAIRGPYQETLALWDEMLVDAMVYAIGGSDAHAMRYRLGPLHKTLFPYRDLFTTVNMHTLLTSDWTGELAHDQTMVYDALGKGRGFVGYDRIASTVGTSMIAEDGANRVTFGETLCTKRSAVFRVCVPRKARLRLLHDGRMVAECRGRTLEYRTEDRGVYRFEAYRSFWGRQRGWIFGNPIRVMRAGR